MESSAGIGTTIVDDGQIDSMIFPVGWVAGEPAENPGIGSRWFREVYREDSPETSICFFYRGLPVADGPAAAFKGVLARPPHALSDDELQSLSRILEHKTPLNSELFEMTSARTEDWNGKTVMVIEGQYKESDDRIFEIYVDADGSGRFVQEIFYQAPDEQFSQHAEDARSALQSVKWK